MPEPSLRPRPKLVVTVGVYRSASTWVANVAAEILRLRGPTLILVADGAADIARQTASSSSTFVVKTHRPDPSLGLLVHAAALPVIVTLRDPADAVASLMEQFKERFESARGSVAASCDGVLAMLSVCRPVILRYEAPLARGARTVAELAAHLGVAIDDDMAHAIAARFAPTEVKRLIEGFAAEGLFGHDPQPYHVHAPTQWHPGHIGTGRIGSQHAILTPDQIESVRMVTRRFSEHFAYGADAVELAEAI